MHVHVMGTEGEAKIWIDPRVEVARTHGLSERTLEFLVALVEERRDEISEAWHTHFGR